MKALTHEIDFTVRRVVLRIITTIFPPPTCEALIPTPLPSRYKNRILPTALAFIRRLRLHSYPVSLK